jgi:hypothetical protein
MVLRPRPLSLAAVGLSLMACQQARNRYGQVPGTQLQDSNQNTTNLPCLRKSQYPMSMPASCHNMEAVSS